MAALRAVWPALMDSRADGRSCENLRNRPAAFPALSCRPEALHMSYYPFSSLIIVWQRASASSSSLPSQNMMKLAYTMKSPYFG